MPALDNTIKAADIASALDIEMTANFDGELNRLTEILGMFGVETVNAGTAMYTYTVTGSLSNTTVAEGDEVPLSKYDVDKTPIGEIPIKPYRKLTTAQAILKGGYENAIAKTDRKMLGDARAGLLNNFFTYLATGTGTSTGAGLKMALAKADSALNKSLEENNDSTERIIHFVSHADISDYLGSAQVTTQTVFGMTYLQNFLGITDIFATSKVPSGTVYATPVENIHIYGIDFATLGDAGLVYEVSDSGIIGVHHVPSYDRTSAETYVLVGGMFLAENLTYIVKGTVTAAEPLDVSVVGTVTTEAASS